MNCKFCTRPLLPQDDVNSSRYIEMGCLNCQISIMAMHKYGDDIVPVKHGITPPVTPIRETIERWARDYRISNGVKHALTPEAFNALISRLTAPPHFESINCSRCGERVSSMVPEGTMVRAFVECPECIAKIPEAVPLDGLLITEADALLILNRLSDLGAALLTEELLLAKRLIQHFHVCDFGYLLTELDDRQRRMLS
jgi:hypothetical protein